MKTRITDLFGVEHPIIQGGLMWIAAAELTSAVANAGAMGFMTALSHETPDGLRNEIRKCRDMTDKPFGINLTFLPSLRQPDYPAYLRVCAEEGIEFIETAGRNPEPYMPHLKAAGIKVIHKCTSVRHALKAQAIGCDAVSIDGFECAGHPGEDDVTSLVLLPVTVDALDIPIVASGGFGDGRGLVAALALGADGMNMGTRFVATKEAPVHDAVKQAILDHNETDTTLIMRTLRNTERVLRNKTAEKVIEIESTGHATIQDIIPYVSGRRGLEEVIRNGNVDEGTMAVGQIIGLIHDIPTVGELIDRIMTEASQVISDRLANLV
ncbi:MAG: nitronate monooxygenase [Actinobacteria bacterium]|nr:nitronate monooxygenase [Actinomycetota bacterium]